MLSLTEAKRKFFDATAPDRLLMEEHQRQLGRHIVMAIDEGKSAAYYEVPWLVQGPFPLFDVDEVTVALMKHARSLGYKVSLIHRQPNVLEISGWAGEPASAAADKPPAKRAAPKKAPPKKQGKKINVTMNDVKRGTLSQRLRQRQQRFNQY